MLDGIAAEDTDICPKCKLSKREHLNYRKPVSLYKGKKKINLGWYQHKNCNDDKGGYISTYETLIGDNLYLGEKSRIEKFAKIGNNVTIGKRSIINEDVIIGDDVVIGNNVDVEAFTVIPSGTIIKHNKLIKPRDYR